MKIVNGSQMKKIDQSAIHEYGIPGVVLMENAGRSVTEEILSSLEGKEKRKVAIVCGRGNNGGDGYVVARHLLQKNVDVEVFIIGRPENIAGDAGIHLRILEKLGAPIRYLTEESNLKEFELILRECNMIVDAIFGTGLTRELNPFFKEIIQMINDAKKEIIAVDIPSGIGADDGKVYGAAVRADKTVVFQLPKIGNINYPGAEYTGEWVLKDIGIPQQIIEKMDLNVHLITKEMVRNILPLRKKDTHKGIYGKICMIAGSVGMAGAAVLVSRSALVSGAGLLKIAVPKAINDILQQKVPEAITVPLEESEKGFIHSEEAEKLISVMEKSDVIAIGPGSGQSKQFHEIFNTVVEHAVQPVVMDADALNILSKDVGMLNRLKGQVVMSPHIAEMSRLTGKDIEYIAQHRIEIASEFSQKWNCTVVLKGARTVVSDGKGKIFINQTGNPGMATAGSGDVLTGLIAGLIAQGIAPVDAAIAAVYIHGYAGDRAAKRLGEYGLLAGDISAEIPLALKELVGV